MKPAEKCGFFRARLRSLADASRGVRFILRTQGNARVHLLATALVLAAGVFFRVTSGEWCLLALAMGLVWAAEGANTAIELLGDRITNERDESIGRAKDAAAGAVLLASVAAAATGLVIFGPRVWLLLRGG
jgi:diacylglycerol kinase (ATP)